MKHGFFDVLEDLQDEYVNFNFLQGFEISGVLNAYDFLHGFCLSFALCLSKEFGYAIETVRNEDGDLIHAYCVDPEEGLYIDVRGITDDPELFFDEFADEVDYAGGEFWCAEDQGQVEWFQNAEDFLNKQPVSNLRLTEAFQFMEKNRHYYDVSFALTQQKEGNDMGKWFLEVIQDREGMYSANMYTATGRIQGLPEHVDYNTLREGIRQHTGVEILKKKDMLFQQCEGKKYAYIDNTQFRGEGKDCRVLLEEMRAGFRPDFITPDLLSDGRKPSLDDRLKAAETKYCTAPIPSRSSALER